MAYALQQIRMKDREPIMAGEKFDAPKAILDDLIANGAASKKAPAGIAVNASPAGEDTAALEARIAELEQEIADGATEAETFDLAGMTYKAKSGGWWEITGGEGFETVKGRGEEDGKAKFAELVAEAVTGPEDGAPS